MAVFGEHVMVRIALPGEYGVEYLVKDGRIVEETPLGPTLESSDGT